MEPQTYATHRKFVPPYHFVTLPLLLVFLFWSAYELVRQFAVGHAVTLGLAVALAILFYYVRIFAMRVQDRLIRLEERIRLQSLVDADFAARIPEFSVDQMVALRFASDEELPALARRVLEERVTGREDIKKLVRTWRPDHARA